MDKAAVIISVYRDAEALEVILHALEQQSERDFSVIVSEDGESTEIREFLARRPTTLTVQHLTQKDEGFRKNRALNRAVLATDAETLIFIDGDCVPHPRFVEAHLKYAKQGVVNCGRRVNLGPKFSARLRQDPSRINELSNVWSYLGKALALHRDRIRNYELGFFVPWLQGVMRKETSILGCNFSLHRDDLIAVNGFDEAYQSPGLGEDTDIEVRLRKNGARMMSNKQIAVQYHLYHRKGYQVITKNREILQQAREADTALCEQGINTHQGQ